VRFADTNILLYAVSRNADEETKRHTAEAILRQGDIGLSVQVLQEFYVQATRGTSPALSAHHAAALVESFGRFTIAPITVGVVASAMATAARFSISYWDAAIREAARTLGCTEVLSEDLAHGQDYAGVVVRNPFR
jgi:predicted nucleic acid-binding protein